VGLGIFKSCDREKTMKTLRKIHLYLGCVFAPLLLFFGVSGIWQTLHEYGTVSLSSGLLKVISTIHTGHRLKSGAGYSSTGLEVLVLLMSVALLVSVAIGIFMAIKSGERLVALLCLAVGIFLPLLAIFLA
jgi:hypothetical protein